MKALYALIKTETHFLPSIMSKIQTQETFLTIRRAYRKVKIKRTTTFGKIVIASKFNRTNSKVWTKFWRCILTNRKVLAFQIGRSLDVKVNTLTVIKF